MKVCSKCGHKKPLAAFSKSVAAKDGRQYCCKECDKKRANAYNKEHAEERRVYGANHRAAHLEKYLARERRYRKEHAAACRVRTDRWREKHAEEYQAYRARYRREHAAERREYHKQWRKKHPELWRQHRRRRRAKERAMSETFTIGMERFVKATWDDRCAFCGKIEDIQIDHWRPLAKGYALAMDNAVPLCCSCNRRKGAKLPEELDDQELVAAVEWRLAEQAQRWLARELVDDFFAA